MLSKTAAAAVELLSSLRLFSRLVIGLQLYNYQIEPLEAIVKSVANKDGLEFLLVFSRQSGKNEAAAHLLVYLMNLYRRTGCSIVYAATGDGMGRGIKRLEERLANRWNNAEWKRYTKPTRRTIGSATTVFISSHPLAAARGETADPLLIVDELQDQNRPHLEAVFTPMRAANNATAVYLGTVKTSHDALWLKKKELEKAQAKDGIQRVFMVGPDKVTADNPNYARFLAHQEQKFGRYHPIVASEYYLEPLDTSGGMFDERRMNLMKGSFGRHRPSNLNIPVIALIDVGGIDEAGSDPIAQLDNPGRDYTICTIVEIVPDRNRYNYRAIDVFTDQGSKHFDGDNPLSKRLLKFLSSWNVLHVVCDKTGIGEGLTDYLSSILGSNYVSGFQFSKYSKAQLGASFLSLIETQRFQYWSSEVEYGDSWWFFMQVKSCSFELSPDGQFEKDLRWGVPASARVNTPQGSKPIHDDRLISAALVAEADKLIQSGKIILGTAKSHVVHSTDPLEGLKF